MSILCRLNSQFIRVIFFVSLALLADAGVSQAPKSRTDKAKELEQKITTAEKNSQELEALKIKYERLTEEIGALTEKGSFKEAKQKLDELLKVAKELDQVEARVSLSRSGEDNARFSNEMDTINGLVSELKTKVSFLQKPYPVYHYVSKEKLLGVSEAPRHLDFNDSKVKDHVKDWTNYFWDLSQQIDPKERDRRHVKGFYASTDPVASRNFGGENWVLYRVELPSNAVIFSLRDLQESNGGNIIPGSFALALESMGCPANLYSDLFMKILSPSCRAIALRILEKLGVDAIVYSWPASTFDDLPFRNQSSFLVIRPEKISENKIAIYSQGQKHNGTEEEKKVISAIFNAARDIKLDTVTDRVDISISSNAKNPLWPGQDYSDVRINKQWIQEHLYDGGERLGLTAPPWVAQTAVQQPKVEKPADKKPAKPSVAKKAAPTHSAPPAVSESSGGGGYYGSEYSIPVRNKGRESRGYRYNVTP